MTVARWVGLARKALHRPPRYVLRRAVQELSRQGQRPWSRLRPRLLTDRALLRALGAPSLAALWERQAAAPFFVTPAHRQEWSRSFLDRFPGAKTEILEAAEAVLAHEMDLLGSGRVALGERLPWHTDWKVGRRWPVVFCHDLDYNELDLPSDVKVPWELSRCQHFTTLGQAYWLTGDERFAREFVSQVTDWVRENPWGHGVNWACTMDVALRAVSWIWGFYFFAGSPACEAPAFRSLFLRALHLHGEFIAANLELSDVNGNHYLVDAVGLVVLGCFFGGSRRGAGWRERGARMVVEEITAQVAEDGVDFEQATAYHRLVLEGFLTVYLLLHLHGRAVPGPAWERLRRMLDFVLAYTKPDGRAPLIGDADDGRIQKLGPEPVNDHRYLLSTGAALFAEPTFKQGAGRFWEASFWLLGPEGADAWERLPAPAAPPASAAFPAGGFWVMRGPAAHLIVDCGDVGLRGRGGHGHSDILSFELYLNGMNVVTDCGAYLYSASREWRNRFRSTAYHNTVEVDGQEVNRLVHPDDLWRLHPDAAPTEVTWRSGADADYFRGGHRGYARLPSPLVHVREIVFHKAAPRVAIRDSFERAGEGSGIHRLTWRFHLDPAVRAALAPAGVRIDGGDRTVWLLPVLLPPGAALRLEEGWVSPSYGVRTRTSVVVLEATVRVPQAAAFLFADAPVPAEERARWLTTPGSAG